MDCRLSSVNIFLANNSILSRHIAEKFKPIQIPLMWYKDSCLEVSLRNNTTDLPTLTPSKKAQFSLKLQFR